MGKRNKIMNIGFSKLQKKALKKKEVPPKEEESIISEENVEQKAEAPKSLRHRRVKNNKTVLSRGQKRRQEKKQKFERRKELVEKIKLDQSMINTTMNKTMNKTIIEEPKKSEKFNLNDLNSNILNLLDDITKEKKTVPEIRAKKKKGRQIM
jgi:hypothetical protein